ncbi:GNAT family N-acetyltransferase [Candidatus Woesearchaeota archaeon]|jgi:ribosomal protein S18 acetylase RimI-like enzyme|nr:GNAT family N-acetyltransferase [Candidatus Woesearchaeota archaeon]MBT6520096.1 GNAT family N-acetyltransferase [Candidatus Woesearchaeota archaeon]MBT7366701.1 GNAT family N-acetyltransferase [Candidatus Woesearchaeota archaeon]
MRIRKFQRKDTIAVALIIRNTFKKFNSKEYFKKDALKTYLNHYDPKLNSEEKLYSNFQRTSIFYVAEENNQIVGLIRGIPERIVNLFVDKNQHKKGIGKKLVLKFENEAKKYVDKINIRSSLYASSFYEKMGYKKTTGIRNFRGLKVSPMKKVLN